MATWGEPPPAPSVSTTACIPPASPPVSQISQHDGAVVIRGAALPLMYRATLALVAKRSRDGLRASPLLQQAVTVLYRACTMSRERHPLAETSPPESSWRGQNGELVDSAEAAQLLGCSRRQVQRLAANGLANRCGSIWVTRRSAALALKAQREAAT
jgi:hypothetical protein